MKTSLRVLTLNTWKCDGRYRDRLNWMAQELVALAPDFVFLQEAFFCPQRSADTAGYLAKALSIQAHRCRGRQKDRLFEGQPEASSSDLAILGVHAPFSHQEKKLAAHPDDTDRKALALDLEFNSLPIRLVNVHLTHLRNTSGQAVRRRQAAQVQDLAFPPAGGITIVGGDFNAVLEDDELQGLIIGPAEADRLLPSKSDFRGTMHGERLEPLLSAKRIDHLFVYKNIDCNVYVTIDKEVVVMNVPIGPQGEFPSDHAGVLLELSVDTTTVDK